MAQFLRIHPDNPQPRLIRKAVEIIERGGVIAYPTDSAYALGCKIGDKEALIRIRVLRQLDEDHNFTLVCRDLSEIATYAQVDNVAFRFLKSYTPGPFTFLLRATREVPRRLLHPKRKTIGIRIPESNIVRELLSSMNEPLMSSTLMMPGDTLPLYNAEEIKDVLGQHIDLIIDGGNCGVEPTTIVDLQTGVPQVIRQGKGVIVYLH